MARYAFDLDDIALAAEFVSQPLGGGHCPGLLIDTDIINALGVKSLVNGDHNDALVDGFFERGVQAVNITGVDKDGVHVLGHQVLELLDLSRNIGVSAFDDEVIGDALRHIFGIDSL